MSNNIHSAQPPQERPTLAREKHIHLVSRKEGDSYIVQVVTAYIPFSGCKLLENEVNYDRNTYMRQAIKYVRNRIKFPRLLDEEGIMGHCSGPLHLDTQATEDFAEFNVEILSDTEQLTYKVTERDESE